MRSMRFRAWATEECVGNWAKPGMYTGFSFDSIYAGRDESNVSCERGPDGSGFAELPILGKGWDGLVVMQYTGLLDKHGVEIYEGDVVRLWAEWDELETEFRGIVRWDDMWPEFHIKQTYGPTGECASAFYDPMGAKFAWESLEVVGNIHSNPELLDAKEGE